MIQIITHIGNIMSYVSGISTIVIMGFYLVGFMTTSGDEFVKMEKRIFRTLGNETRYASVGQVSHKITT